MARALAAQFADPVRAADEARFYVARMDLGRSIGMYMPPEADTDQPALILDRMTHAREREAMFALAVAHHYLGHRTVDAYVYTRQGARYGLPLEEEAAREFAATFLRALPAPAMTVVNSYGARVVSRRG